MNKYLAILLIFALLMCSLLGCTTLAYASTDDSASDIHLVNPSSVVVIQDNLYIADNVTDNSCVVLQFDLSSDVPAYTTMFSFEGNIALMRSYDNVLYILLGDKYVSYDTTTEVSTTTDTAITDIAIFSYNDNSYTYTIQNGTVYRGSANKGWDATSMAISDNTLHLLWGAENATVSLVQDGDINESYTSGSNNTYNAISVLGDKIVQFSSNNITIDGLAVTTNSSDIQSVAIHNDSLLILSGNTLTQYTTTDNITYTPGYIIGSDTVSISVPSLDDITKYTLVQSNGYPTNIVYKTTDASSVENLIELTSEKVLILSYEGSQNIGYYYVYTDNGFGWIKKGSSTIAEESTLHVIDTNISSIVSYTAKLISPYSVTIYSLPDTQYVRTTFTQSTTTPTTVNLLQQITDSASTTWYYISYTLKDTTQYGYVTSGAIGYIYSSGTTSNIVLDANTPYLKIDSTLQGDVNIYLTKELTQGTQLVDDNGDTIVLAGDTRVSVITVAEHSSYIQVTASGNTYYGWVSNNCLIPTGSLTTSTIVGLILLGVAIVLTITTVVIVKTRKNNIVKNDII